MNGGFLLYSRLLVGSELMRRDYRVRCELFSEHTVKAMLPRIRISFLALRPSVYRISLTKKTASYVVKNSLKCKKGKNRVKKEAWKKRQTLLVGATSMT